MKEIKASDIASLRAKTGLTMMECKADLVESKGDESGAIDILKKKGMTKAGKKSERETKTGLIEGYVNGGKIGVLVEVLAETDFVVKNEEFREFVHDLALQIAASAPKYVGKENVPEEEVREERKDLEAQIENEGKPKNIAEKIVEGRMDKFYAEICLLEQPFIKDPDKKISELLTEKIAKIGENIVISRFVRYSIGE